MEELGLHRAISITLKRGRHGPSYSTKVQALDLRGSLDKAVCALTSIEDNQRAMELASRLGMGGYGSSVYIIGPKDGSVVKIGQAADPKLRLSTLQVGNWHDLFVHGLLWVDRGPGAIECYAHKAAKEMNWSVRGEWFNASIEEAAELVLKAARYAKIPCYDSAIWLKNWSDKLEALAVQNGAASRIAA